LEQWRQQHRTADDVKTSTRVAATEHTQLSTTSAATAAS